MHKNIFHNIYFIIEAIIKKELRKAIQTAEQFRDQQSLGTLARIYVGKINTKKYTFGEDMCFSETMVELGKERLSQITAS